MSRYSRENPEEPIRHDWFAGARSTRSEGSFAAPTGSAAPNGGTDYTLHGFSFASSEARQAAAEGHHLWAAFIAFTLKQGYDGEPTMDDSRDRELFEAFVEGGWQEAQQIEKSSPAAGTKGGSNGN